MRTIWRIENGTLRVQKAGGGIRGGPSVALHRLIIGETSEHTDHRDYDGTNNRRTNLRPCSRSQNCGNARYGLGKSGFRGVWDRGKGSKGWRAFISIDGASRHLGTFDTPEEAARAYDAAAIEHFGEFATTNVKLGLLPIDP